MYKYITGVWSKEYDGCMWSSPWKVPWESQLWWGRERFTNSNWNPPKGIFHFEQTYICQVSYSGFGLSRQDVDQGGGREDAWGSSPRSPSPSPSSSPRCRTRTAPHSPSGSPTTSRLQCATSLPPGWRWPPPSWGTTQPSRRWWRGWGTSTEWCWKGNLILNTFLPWQTWYFE